MKNKKIIIICMLVAILIMVVIYAAFQTQLKINGTSKITSTWQIEITNITSTATGLASNITEPSYSGTNASFNARLRKPGDKMEYSITVKNNGSVNAIIDEVKAEVTGSYVIVYSIEGLQEKVRLASGASKTFKVIVEFDVNATSIPSETSKEIDIGIMCIQDTGQTLTPTTPDIEGENINLLARKILLNNPAQSDASIDFSKISSETNGKGLYYTNTNTESGKTTYYFRGNVTNNYVSFAGTTWRIVRINEDGSIRLVTQDSVGTSAFNSSKNDNAYVGYMYGAAGGSTYALTHANTNSSAIKTYLDTWYQNNLASYSSYLADAGFCNDRSVASTAGSWYSEDTALGYGTNRTYYGAYNRLINLNQPQYACPQSNDLFTTSSSGKGNKALTNPIGLITVDEVVYAGGKNNINNQNYYLVNGSDFWTMSPRAFSGGEARAWNVDGGGYVYIVAASGAIGVRPTINLKSNVEITIGDGTEKRPYTIKVN